MPQKKVLFRFFNKIFIAYRFAGNLFLKKKKNRNFQSKYFTKPSTTLQTYLLDSDDIGATWSDRRGHVVFFFFSLPDAARAANANARIVLPYGSDRINSIAFSRWIVKIPQIARDRIIYTTALGIRGCRTLCARNDGERVKKRYEHRNGWWSKSFVVVAVSIVTILVLGR